MKTDIEARNGGEDEFLLWWRVCVALAQHGNEKVKYPVTKAMSVYMCRRRKVDYDTRFFLRHHKEERKIRTKKIDNDDQQKCREKRAKGINMSVAE